MAEAWKCYLRLLQRLPDRLPPVVRLAEALTFMAGEVVSWLSAVREHGRDKVGATLGVWQSADELYCIVLYDSHGRSTSILARTAQCVVGSLDQLLGARAVFTYCVCQGFLLKRRCLDNDICLK